MPSKKKNSSTVSVVHQICCGLDVHKKSVSVCILSSDQSGAEQSEVTEFGTFTDELTIVSLFLYRGAAESCCSLAIRVASEEPVVK